MAIFFHYFGHHEVRARQSLGILRVYKNVQAPGSLPLIFSLDQTNRDRCNEVFYGFHVSFFPIFIGLLSKNRMFGSHAVSNTPSIDKVFLRIVP